jgi:uncharacterized membrane protein YfcA
LNLVIAPLLLILGFAVGVPAAMVGVGGGLFIVPALILFFGLPAQNAVAISVVAMLGTAFSASIGYIRQRRVDYKLSLLYDVLDVPGVLAGAYLTTILPQNILAGVCGFFIVFISMLLMRNRKGEISEENCGPNARSSWKRKCIDSSNQVFEYAIRKPGLAMISSFAGGLVTGLVGLGGGITDTTTMILVGVPPHIAVATSEFAMALTNGAGVVAHGFLQNILWDYALILTAGTFIGAQIGVKAARKVKGETLTKLLCVMALVLGLRLILSLFQI